MRWRTFFLSPIGSSWSLTCLSRFKRMDISHIFKNKVSVWSRGYLKKWLTHNDRDESDHRPEDVRSSCLSPTSSSLLYSLFIDKLRDKSRTRLVGGIWALNSTTFRLNPILSMQVVPFVGAVFFLPSSFQVFVCITYSLKPTVTLKYIFP